VNYEVRFDRAADRDLDRLPPTIQSRVLRRIEALSADPRPSDARALKANLKGLFRLRVGAYRICYCVDAERGVVTVAEVGHRRDAYQRLARRRR
jgi:mRNA interferase RelE/StbE